ncbi:MAG: NUDIX domain-containing protein [Candidatus Eisenbacteria bacterium]
MPMSEHIRQLRALIGTRVLELPTVTVLVVDSRGRVLLVRHVEGNDWTTPGGMIEPYETPADAALREVWEETGLLVELSNIVGVFGGPECASIYSNGDQVAWVTTVFRARAVAGSLKADGDEVLEARYLTRNEIRDLPCKPHVSGCLDALFSGGPSACFQPPKWRPIGM